jgi:hypothetical protein
VTVATHGSHQRSGAETGPLAAAGRTFDTAVHGLVNLRFIEAPARFVARFSAQWGPCLTPPTGPVPDLVVRFGTLEEPALCFVGQRWAAAGDRHFFLLDESDGTVVARLPMDALGGPCEIHCRPDAASVPFLTEALCLASLGRGFVPLHASALEYRGLGVVVMGWPKGGKTGALLAFLGHGARYVGDEWVLLASDGREVLGLPLPLSVSEWQLPYLGTGPSNVPLQKRLLFQTIHALDRASRLVSRGPFARTEPAKLLRKGVPVLRRQLKVTRPPAAWFGRVGHLRAPLDRLFLLEGHAAPTIEVERQDPAWIARRMVFANEHEWRPLMERYRGYRFAFPDRPNPLLDALHTRLGDPLAAAMAGKRVYRVRHPYGGSLEELFRAMEPHCRAP